MLELVRRLSVTLFILGVQAKELHIRDQKNILKNSGYMHIRDFGKKFLTFFNISVMAIMSFFGHFFTQTRHKNMLLASNVIHTSER